MDKGSFFIKNIDLLVASGIKVLSLPVFKNVHIRDKPASAPTIPLKNISDYNHVWWPNDDDDLLGRTYLFLKRLEFTLILYFWDLFWIDNTYDDMNNVHI